MLTPAFWCLAMGEVLTVAGMPGQGVGLERIGGAAYFDCAILFEKDLARQDELHRGLHAAVDGLGGLRLRRGGDLSNQLSVVCTIRGSGHDYATSCSRSQVTFARPPRISSRIYCAFAIPTSPSTTKPFQFVTSRRPPLSRWKKNTR